jgi:short-subunit dehydrogenase
MQQTMQHKTLLIYALQGSIMDINGKLIVVTGASSGIGAEVSRLLAARGAHVLLLARTRDKLVTVAGKIQVGGGQASVYPVDLSNLEATADVASQISQTHGTPDVIINNAGAGRWLFTEDTAPQEAVEMMAVPYFAAFAMTRAFLPDMLKRDSGFIVNITSPAAFIAWPGATSYVVARAAMRSFSDALRADLGGTGIRVGLVVPGLVNSPYFEHNPGALGKVPRISRLFRTLTPQQAAQAILRCIQHDRRQVIVPLEMYLVAVLHRWFPRPVEWLVNITGARRPGG